MDQSCVLILPPLLPRTPLFGLALAELLRVRHIADGRVEPHVEHLSVGSLHGHWDTPVQVARHRTRLQIHIEPRLALAVHVRAPLLMLLEDPLLQPLLIVVQRQIPVLRLLQHRRRTRDGRLRIDQLRGREVAAALLALVAVGTRIAAVGALARHVAVGQELLRLLVVELLGGLLHQLALVVHLTEPLGGKLVVGLRGGAAVDVERDAELLEALLDHLVVAVDHILRRDALLAGANRDGHTVLVTSADKHHLALLQAQVAHIDISRHVHTGQMPDVHSAISIGQRRRHRRTLKSLVFHLSKIRIL